MEWKTLGEVGKRNHGTSITASRMKEIHKEKGTIRIFAGGKTIVDVNPDDIPQKDIIFETSIIVKSRGCIDFEFYGKPFSHKNELWSYTIKDKLINQKFIYYYLVTQKESLQQIARGSSVKIPQLSISDTDKLRIPIPPLEEQERIVEILDRFDALVNDISIGLPAEIEARRKQYEYYRNKLLSFPAL